jgi:hypothetical protein
LSDKSQWHPEAALVAFLFLSILFVVAGCVNLAGIFTVELRFFEHLVTSRLGNVLWITAWLFVALVAGYMLRKRWMKR